MLVKSERTASRFKPQRGIALLESLIAIVVMALGILGIVGVQMRTLTDTQAGVRRAQAIRLIEDLSERIQNNPDALGNLSTYTTKPTSVTTDCTSTACNPADLAKFDIKQWRTAVTSGLPDGDATVFVPKGGGRQLGVLISWTESRFSSSGNALSTAEKTALNAPMAVSGTDAADQAIQCTDGHLCHLQYIQPTQRCAPWGVGGATLYCPN